MLLRNFVAPSLSSLCPEKYKHVFKIAPMHAINRIEREFKRRRRRRRDEIKCFVRLSGREFECINYALLVTYVRESFRHSRRRDPMLFCFVRESCAALILAETKCRM